MSSGAPARTRLKDLTDTQRRVLELIAEGKTNYEIGQQLGITLDGAKYHVSEILNKLGVDSREEAAALVRPLGPRWPRRMPARRLSLGAAAAVGLVGILGILLALRDHDSDQLPEVQVAFLVGDPGLQRRNLTRQIAVVDGDGNMRSFGQPGRYAAIEWAPNGEHLLAVTMDGLRTDTFTVFDARTGDSESWKPPGNVSELDWSPDASMLALRERPADGPSILYIVTPDGTLVASTELVRESDPGAQASGILWSPDSEWVVGWYERTIALLSVSGESRQMPLPDEFPNGSVVVVDWTAAGLRIAAEPQQPPLFGPRAWVLSDPRDDWQPTEAIPTPDATEHNAVRERFKPDFTGGPPSPTADGAGWVYQFTRPLSRNDLSPPLEFVVVRLDGREIRVPAPPGVDHQLSDISAVVVPR